MSEYEEDDRLKYYGQLKQWWTEAVHKLADAETRVGVATKQVEYMEAKLAEYEKSEWR